MTSNRKLLITALTVCGLGLGADALVRAQQASTAPAYVIAEVNVKDAASFQRYSSQVPAIIKQYGGEYLVRGGHTVPLEGAPPGQRVVVIRFASVAQAQAWYNSPAYSALRPIREQSAQSRNFIAEGVQPAP